MPKQLALCTAIWLCAVSAASAGSSPDAFSVLSKPLPPGKPLVRTGTGSRNPCAALGPGFKRVEGTDTCVKIGGAVSVDAGSSVGR